MTTAPGGRLGSRGLASKVNKLGEAHGDEPVDDDGYNTAGVDVEACVIWLLKYTIKRYNKYSAYGIDKCYKWRLWVGTKHQ